MKNWKRLGAGVMILALVLGLLSPQTVNAAKKKKKVKLNKKKVTLTVGKTVKLKLKNNKKKVKWSSNKKKTATVSKKGVVKAKKKGTAKITAKVGKKKYTCKVTVKAKKKATTGGGNKTPGTNQTVTGTPGKNIPITGDVFQIGSYKLALGLTKAQINTILGTLSTNVKRVEKSPQGFDVIAFRPNGNKSSASDDAKYSTYILVYLKGDKVVGICGISKTMSYANVVSAGAATLETNSRWSPVHWYDTIGSNPGAGAYQTVTSNANVLAFVDYYGDKTAYCIQAFSNEYSVESMTDLSNNEASCSYGSDVLTAMKTESGELINAYLAFYGVRILKSNTKLGNAAQKYCSTMLKNSVTDAGQAERSNAEIKSAFQSAGINCDRYGECVLVGSMDAIGFANSIVQSEQRRMQICNEDDYSVMGLGTDAYSDGSLYYPYLVIDFIDRIRAM